jgi:NAD(P)-dependent dehydrogenase (short-subunit alcohol dehydrogenase family)
VSGLEGRIAAVTGAARGLGRTTALALARVGVRIILVGRSIRETPVTFVALQLRDTARCTPEQFAAGAVAVLAGRAASANAALTKADLRAAQLIPA